jgi:hypothetical protein
MYQNGGDGWSVSVTEALLGSDVGRLRLCTIPIVVASISLVKFHSALFRASATPPFAPGSPPAPSSASGKQSTPAGTPPPVRPSARGFRSPPPLSGHPRVSSTAGKERCRGGWGAKSGRRDTSPPKLVSGLLVPSPDPRALDSLSRQENNPQDQEQDFQHGEPGESRY